MNKEINYIYRMKSIIFIFIFFGFWVQFSCVSSSAAQEMENPQVIDSIPFLTGEARGTLDHKSIDEASGMVASRAMPGFLWTHNDSGDSSRLFLINDKGAWSGSLYMPSAKNVDWEDMTYAQDPITGKRELIIADIGDNLAVRPYTDLYWIDDEVIQAQEKKEVAFKKRLTLQYHEGPRDAETVFFDPVSNNVYIITKRETAVFLYEINPNFTSGDTITLEKCATLPLTQIVAGDINPDGNEIILKNYDFIYYYRRQPGQTIKEALLQSPVKLPYTREPQGEALCFGIDNKAFFTLSEKTPFGIVPVLYRYWRK